MDTEELLKGIECGARARFMTVMQRDSLDELTKLVREARPKTILELGTAVGYSGIAMLSAYCGARLYTVEYLEERAEEAKHNFEKAGFKDRVTQFVDSADTVLTHLSGEFDFMFVDAAKAHYGEYFAWLDKHLARHGTMVFDNVLFRGYVKGGKTYRHRMNTIVTKLREFIKQVENDSSYNCRLLDVGDGLLIAEKK